MNFVKEILKEEDGYCQILNGFTFDPETTFVGVDARLMEGGKGATALCAIAIGDALELRVSTIYETKTALLDYYAESSSKHYLLLSGGTLVVLDNGKDHIFDIESNAYLFRLAPIDTGTIAVFGEDGEAFVFRAGKFERITLDTEETIYAMHFLSPDNGAAVGDYGTLLVGDHSSLSTIELPLDLRLSAVRMISDTEILLGSVGGDAYRLVDGELKELEGTVTTIFDITLFRGYELWGDDETGVLWQQDNTLESLFDTGIGYRLNSTPSMLTIVTGSKAYIMDGEYWSCIRLTPNAPSLFVREAIGFVPLSI